MQISCKFRALLVKFRVFSGIYGNIKFNKLSPFFISVKSTLAQVWYTIEGDGMMPPEKTRDLMIEAHNPNDR